MSRWSDDNAHWLKSASRWLAEKSEPLCLRAHMASPVASGGDNGLQIEGALQYVVIVRETHRLPDDVFFGCTDFVDIPIPIVDEEINGKTIAKASWAQLPEGALYTKRSRRKKTRIDVFGKGNLTTKCGELKALDITVDAITTPYLDFYVVGDRDKLSDLLSDVGVLGRSRGGGMGVVQGWEVLDADINPFVHQQRPMRSIPVSDDHEASVMFEYGTYELREQTTRAPYWHMATRALCAVPV
jgi:hypothetical protein